jgi:hypothetical protein
MTTANAIARQLLNNTTIDRTKEPVLRCHSCRDMQQTTKRPHSNNRRLAYARLIKNYCFLKRSLRSWKLMAETGISTKAANPDRVIRRLHALSEVAGEITKDFKALGVNRKAALIDLNGQWISFQHACQILRELRLEIENEIASQTSHSSLKLANNGSPGGQKDDGDQSKDKGDGEITTFLITAITALVVAAAAAIGKSLGEKFTDLFNQSDDDQARERVSSATHQDIQRIADDELVGMINAMLDGPTGDDDEAAIIKIFEASDCERRSRLVARIGLDELLDNIDGIEWDRFMNLLVDCGVVGIERMDDDASRQFVNTRNCVQLGQLPMLAVRQLVLNMFAGSCGDDDEDAILRLLRCQSRARLQQLVTMPNVDVGRFDYNFDGDQWDDLEQLFAANGITLDP